MSYSRISLTSDITLSWAYPFTGGTVVSDINDVESDDDSRTLTLPSSKLVPVGTSLLFNNVGFHDFTLLDNSGNPIGNIILPSEIRQIYLIDTSTDAGIWRMIPFGEGSSPISAISMDTSNSGDSIKIIPGTITSPGGNFDFTLSSSLQDLNRLTTITSPTITSSGFVVYTQKDLNDPDSLTWKTVSLMEGENININNGNGLIEAPRINLNPTISVTALNVGSFVFNGTTLTTSEANGSLTLSSNGTGLLELNKVKIDTTSNITNVNDLTVSGSIFSPAVARAQCLFVDDGTTQPDNITVFGKDNKGNKGYNIASVTGGNGSYTVHFPDPSPFLDGNYTVLLSLKRGTEAIAPFTAFFQNPQTSCVKIYTVDTLGNLVTAGDGVSVVVFAN